MTAASDMTDAELAAARSKARQLMAALIGGAALQMREHTYELLVVNPHDLGKGTLHVDYADGTVYWERTVWDDLGRLPGYTGGTTGTAQVGADTIRAALSAPCRIGEPV
jgi:hypothetical protein